MAIITSEFETLVNVRGEHAITEGNHGLTALVKQSRDMVKDWNNYVVNNESGARFDVTPDMKFVYQTNEGEHREADISDFAFSQLCTRMGGAPASYISRCVDKGKIDLALDNFRAWKDDCKSNMIIRENKGIVRAVLSDSYAPFDSYKVLKTLNNTLDTTKYQPSQIYLSTDRLSVRFVNFTPLPIDDGTPLYAGFTTDSSDVGRGSLNMRFFIYRFACTNGLVISDMGGTLFRQSHIGSNMMEGKISLFNRAFMDIDKVTEKSVELIKANKGRILKDYEVDMYLEKARRDMKLSQKSMDKMQELISVYGNTRWGIINSVTELAQNFTLDTRINMESWAGNLFTKNAA